MYASSALFRKLDILVIDDDPATIGMVREAIRGLGAGNLAHGCHMGGDALNLAVDRDWQYEVGLDLVIVDMRLPDMSGIRVVDAFHEHCPGLPVLVFTSVAEEQQVLEAARARVRGYLLKDDDEISMPEVIMQTLQGDCLFSRELLGYPLVAKVMADGNKRLGLTMREWQLLDLFYQGSSYSEAARHMGISTTTVQSHVKNAYYKLGVTTRSQALAKIMRLRRMKLN